MAANEDAQEQARLAKKSGGSTAKVTRAQIRVEAEKREAAARGQAKPSVETHLDKPLEDNVNRADPTVVTATNVDEAIAALRYSIAFQIYRIHFTVIVPASRTLHPWTSTLKNG